MDISYSIKRFKQSRSLKLRVNHKGEVIVTCPFFVNKSDIDSFVQAHRGWIIEQKKKVSELRNSLIYFGDETDFIQRKKEAYELCFNLIKHYNKHYNVTVNIITIRNQTSRWGSCSVSNNLSFNWRIVLLPLKLAEYLVVHEMCHCIEHNHSQRFWDRVSETIPDYKERREELKSI